MHYDRMLADVQITTKDNSDKNGTPRHWSELDPNCLFSIKLNLQIRSARKIRMLIHVH